MKTCWIILIGLGVVLSEVSADAEVAEQFSSGNSKLRAAAFDAAIDAYGNLSRKGIVSAEVYANLGEANRAKGDAVAASTNYVRALTLDPGQREAMEGLARLSNDYGLPRRPRQWMDEVVMIAHPETLIVIGTATFWVGVLFFGVCLFSGRKPIPTSAALLVAAVGGGFFVIGWFADPRLDEGEAGVVVAEAGSKVLTNPSDNASPISSIPMATPVTLLSPRGAWTYVEMPGGVRGWVPSNDVKAVWPVDES